MLQSMTVVKDNRANWVQEDAIIVVQQVGTTARPWLLWHVLRTHRYHLILHDIRHAINGHVLQLSPASRDLSSL